jgi:hypothetical protein
MSKIWKTGTASTKISNFVPSSDAVQSLKLDVPDPFFSESVEGSTTSPVDKMWRANGFTLFGLAGGSSESLRYTVSTMTWNLFS